MYSLSWIDPKTQIRLAVIFRNPLQAHLKKTRIERWGIPVRVVQWRVGNFLAPGA